MAQSSLVCGDRTYEPSSENVVGQLLVFGDLVIGFRVECCGVLQLAILWLLSGNADRYGIGYPVGDILDGDIRAFRQLLHIDAIALGRKQLIVDAG